LDEKGKERIDPTQGEVTPADRRRAWYNATWLIPTLLALGVLSGVAIGFGLASEGDSETFSTPPTLFVEEQPAISDCELEIAGWIDHIVAYGNAGFQDVVFEYGSQSSEFQFIRDTFTKYYRLALQVGAEEAYQEVAPSIALFCGVPID
jgi:hypothetical protein